jgi:predicted HD phosphohydrolase
MDPVDAVFELMSKSSPRRYGAVNLLEHALQCGLNAEQAGAPSPLVTACLLHDIGSVLVGDARAFIERGEDAEHELRGARFLSAWFGPEVTEPVRLHVGAKRYLTATDPAYFARLSAGSVRTLELQGGPFSSAEAQCYEAHEFATAALRLRAWDEAAKIAGRETPGLKHFRPHLMACLRETP